MNLFQDNWDKIETLYQTRTFIQHNLRMARTEKSIREWDAKLAENQKEIDKLLPKAWQK